jgi:hypothetical protein
MGKLKSEMWVALVGACQRNGVSFLGNAGGGYVNVVASATTPEHFLRKVRKALDEVGLELIDIDDLEPLSMRLSKKTVSEEILTMARTVEKIDSVAFGMFYTFDDE